MSDFTNVPETQPFFLEGNDVGVLISHGFTGTPQSMRPLGEYLHREGGYTVSCPRLSGHGTTPDEMARSTAEQWIADLEAAMQKLKERCSSLFITGLSMGGTLALYMAATHQVNFKGAIPINAALTINSPDLASLALLKGAPATIPGLGSDIKQEGIFEQAYSVTPVPSIRQLYTLMSVTRDLMPRVLCPLLVFQSRTDHVVPPANGDLIMQTAGSQEKRLVWLENSFHVATLDNDKDLIGAETVAFIKKRVGK